MISEQIRALRDVAQAYENTGIDTLLRGAANTIEELSAKLQLANMERSTQYYEGDVTDTNVGHKTNYDRIRSMSIEELIDKIFDMEAAPMYEIPFCGNRTACDDILDSGEEVPKEMCRQCLKDWLHAESEE